jgi:hypothetical protein
MNNKKNKIMFMGILFSFIFSLLIMVPVGANVNNGVNRLQIANNALISDNLGIKADFIYLPLTVTDTSIKVGGVCYQYIGSSDDEPNTLESSIQGRYGSCSACNSSSSCFLPGTKVLQVKDISELKPTDEIVGILDDGGNYLPLPKDLFAPKKSLDEIFNVLFSKIK